MKIIKRHKNNKEVNKYISLLSNFNSSFQKKIKVETDLQIVNTLNLILENKFNEVIEFTIDYVEKSVCSSRLFDLDSMKNIYFDVEKEEFTTSITDVDFPIFFDTYRFIKKFEKQEMKIKDYFTNIGAYLYEYEFFVVWNKIKPKSL